MRGGALSLLLAVTLMLGRAGCVLDTAHVEFVPPSTVRVLAVYRCGGIMCWERFVEIDQVRKGVSAVCERDDGDALERDKP